MSNKYYSIEFKYEVIKAIKMKNIQLLNYVQNMEFQMLPFMIGLGSMRNMGWMAWRKQEHGSHILKN